MGTNMSEEVEYAGFWKRVGAYFVDIIPVIVLVSMVFYFFLGFDEVLSNYLAERDDANSRGEFLNQRDSIRDISLIVWLLYSTIMDMSSYQGTFGKRLFGIKVVDSEGSRLTASRAIARNLLKILSLIPLSLGFIWIAFSKKKQGWHDMIAKTYVMYPIREIAVQERVIGNCPKCGEYVQAGARFCTECGQPLSGNV